MNQDSCVKRFHGSFNKTIMSIVNLMTKLNKSIEIFASNIILHQNLGLKNLHGDGVHNC